MERINAVLVEGNDDVVVLIEPVEAGSQIVYRDGDAVRGLPASEAVPVYHKAALRAIPHGHVVRKYGEPIGVATRDIRAGGHVHTHNLKSAEAGL